MDDRAIWDNRDLALVLSTIAVIVGKFLNAYPEKYVFFQGSTKQRTRLYRMAIGNNLDELIEMYHIWGILEDGALQAFTKNRPYVAFLIQRKLLNWLL